MALPRLRPFGHLPAPFGRDWAMLPPGHSLRAELKALYAAMLRTFCMSDQAIRSFCKWVPLDRRPHAVAEASAINSVQETIFDAPFEGAAQPSTDTHAFELAPRRASVHWAAVAGGACALGGAAILGWIALDHLSQRHSTTDVKLADAVSAMGESRPTNARLPDLVAIHQAADDAAPVLARVAVPPASTPLRAPTPIEALPGSALPSASASNAKTASGLVRPTVDKPVSPRLKNIAEKTIRPHERNIRREARITAANHASYPTITHRDLSRGTVRLNASRASAAPSSAGAYSPFAPSQLGVDEYAAVTMSAATHVREISSPRPASAITPSATTRTDWMNHLSQRRVTEVPEQFAR